MERLFHFSDDPGITRFVPRRLRHPGKRRAGQDWLNGPLVWAIDAVHAAHYLFPRDCPRIVVSRRPDTTQQDIAAHLGAHRRIAYIEDSWLSRMRRETLYRYSLPPGSFTPLEDAGMFVSRDAVTPDDMTPLSDLPKQLETEGVTLIPCYRLTGFHHLWETSLHISGMRLRNAQDWPT